MKRGHWAMAVFTWALAACAERGAYSLEQRYAAYGARACPGDGPHSFYFPSGVLSRAGDPYGAANDASARLAYSAYLTAMSEPSLSCGAVAADESYRFLWLRTWSAPIAVRIVRSGTRYELFAVVLSGRGGYEPGHVARRVHRTLTQDEWDGALADLERMNFWSASSAPAFDPSVVEVDGAEWIVEGRKERYHAVARWGGNDGTGTFGAGLLSLADLRFRPDEIY